MRGASPPHLRLVEPGPVPPSPLQQGRLCQDRSTDSGLQNAETQFIFYFVTLAGGICIMHYPALCLNLGILVAHPAARRAGERRQCVSQNGGSVPTAHRISEPRW